MTPDALHESLTRIVSAQLRLSVMIWGAPGIGKSSIVAQVAEDHDLALIDVRLSQLAPTDLRGLPVPRDNQASWLAPDFLPTDGAGILFFDELNMAPPVVQGIAQQLILDRRVGSYRVPDGWFIWAAGNRKDDHAAVYDMPAPLGNRFIHFDVEPDLESFRRYAMRHDISDLVVAFLSFRPELLHRSDNHTPAWPSPRSWEMASQLASASMDVAPAVGIGAAGEFRAFAALAESLPNIERILAGDPDGIAFPKEPSQRYALTIGLSHRADKPKSAAQALSFLAAKAGAEWVQLAISQIFYRMRRKGHFGRLVKMLRKDPALQPFLDQVSQMHVK